MSDEQGRRAGPRDTDGARLAPSPDPADYFYAWYATRHGRTSLTGAGLSLELFTSFLADHITSGSTEPSLEELLETLPIIWVGLRDLPRAKHVTEKAYRRALLMQRWQARTGGQGLFY